MYRFLSCFKQYVKTDRIIINAKHFMSDENPIAIVNFYVSGFENDTTGVGRRRSRPDFYIIEFVSSCPARRIKRRTRTTTHT